MPRKPRLNIGDRVESYFGFKKRTGIIFAYHSKYFNENRGYWVLWCTGNVQIYPFSDLDRINEKKKN